MEKEIAPHVPNNGLGREKKVKGLTLDYPQWANGMYNLRKQDFDDIARAVFSEFMPECLTRVGPVDIDTLLLDCFNLLIEHRYLSHSGAILGMIAFADTEWTPVTGISREPEMIYEGTVCIDPRLLGPAQVARARFTKAHEGSHWVLHRSYHSPDKREYVLRRVPSVVACRSDNIERSSWSSDAVWTESHREEWQADSLAAALLMPREPFIDAYYTAVQRNGFKRYYVGKGNRRYQTYDVISEVAGRFMVSRQAAAIRIRQLGLSL